MSMTFQIFYKGDVEMYNILTSYIRKGRGNI